MYVPYGCPNCGNVKRGVVHFFDKDVREPVCPECGQGELKKKNIIHLLVGKPGNYKIACARGQELSDKGQRPSYICSIAAAATCYECLEAVDHDLGDGEVPTRQKASLHHVPIE